MNKSSRKVSGKAIIRTVLSVISVAVIGFVLYVNDFYHANPSALAVLDEVEGVELLEKKGQYVFVPDTATAGLIFYPGGKVEVESYIPLMARFAEQGVLCVLMEMPGNLAVLDIHAADGVTEEYPEVERWYMGGHSLGGAMAASYTAKHAEEFEGLLLLAAYSTEDLSDTDLEVLAVFGSEDKVLDQDAFEENITNLPAGYHVEVLTGGNHAQFGDYGAQKGDGEAFVSREEQMKRTAELFAEMLK